jgi:hypothetical protein
VEGVGVFGGADPHGRHRLDVVADAKDFCAVGFEPVGEGGVGDQVEDIESNFKGVGSRFASEKRDGFADAVEGPAVAIEFAIEDYVGAAFVAERHNDVLEEVVGPLVAGTGIEVTVLENGSEAVEFRLCEARRVEASWLIPSAECRRERHAIIIYAGE